MIIMMIVSAQRVGKMYFVSLRGNERGKKKEDKKWDDETGEENFPEIKLQLPFF